MRPRGLGRGLGALIPAAPGRFTDGPLRGSSPPVPVEYSATERANAERDNAEQDNAEQDSVGKGGAAAESAEEHSNVGSTPAEEAVALGGAPVEDGAVDQHAAQQLPVRADTDVAEGVPPASAAPAEPRPSVGSEAEAERATAVVPPSGVPVRWSVAAAPARAVAGTGLSMSGQLAAVLASRLPEQGSDTVSAVDRWLWRDGEPQLPGGPAAERVDVPRGTAPLGLAAAAAEAADEMIIEAHPLDVPADPNAEPAAEVDEVAAGGAVYAELDPASIAPNPRQPRQVFDQDSLDELAASIREVGLLQPVVVRAVGDRYELVMGERRLRAAQLAGLERIPAIVKTTGDDVLLRDALLENIQRVQLNPLEEAAAYGQLLEDFGCTQEELASRLGRSRPQVTNTLRLLKLTPPVQRRVAAGVLSAGHAKALLALADAGEQERLATRVVVEGLSVRSLEELVSAGAPAGAPRGRHSHSRVPSAGFGSSVATRLADRLDTRVTVSGSQERGRLVIEFAGADDLARLADLIDPPVAPG